MGRAHREWRQVRRQWDRELVVVSVKPFEPRAGVGKADSEGFLRRLGKAGTLYQVDVLRITQRSREMKLVESRSPPKRERTANFRLLEDLDQSSADDQILLDL